MKHLKTVQNLLISTIILLAGFAAFAVFPSTIHAQDNGVTLTLPSLGLSVPVGEIGTRQLADGSTIWDMQNQGMNIGHLSGTAWLDTPGNMVIAGHSELAQRVHGTFYTLDQMKTNDTFTLSFGSETRQYTVTQVYTVDLSDLSPLYPTADERVTLITCDTGSYTASTGVYNKRIIVVGQRSG